MAKSGAERHLHAITPPAAADSFTERLAKAMSHPIRAAVLAALGERPMSPRQFAGAYRKAPLETISQHFRRLEELGLIEILDERSDPRRRVFGLVRGDVLDQSSLEGLGDAASTVTAAISRNYTDRIAEALQSSVFGNRAGTSFLCTADYLDEQGWSALIAATDALFWKSLYLQTEAAERLSASGERPIPVTTGFGCFVSPQALVDALTVPVIKYGPLETGATASRSLPTTDLAKALSHPVRIAIIRALEAGPLSPSEVRELHPEISMATIFRHFVRLEELNCIEQTEERWVEGSARNRFRLRRHDWRGGSLYAALPGALKRDVDSLLVSRYVERLAESIASGAMESRQDTHLTWSAFEYDERAWSQLTAEIDELFRFALATFRDVEERHARARRARRPVGALMPVTFSLAGFESPAGSWTLSAEAVRDLLGGEDAPSREALDDYRRLIAEDVAA